jgi:uncharacterized surface protein with fasciclin (FAS1) repeats
MYRYRSPEEIRRYDLMKLAVLVTLMVAFILSWVIFRDQSAPDMLGEDMIATPVATAIDIAVLVPSDEEEPEQPAGAGEATPDVGTDPGVEITVPPADTPTIDPPTGALSPGRSTLGGMAAPGSQVVLLVDGQPLGTATAGVDGAWSLAAELAAGVRTIQVQILDNLGNVAAESVPVTVIVQQITPEPAEGSPIVNVPSINPETGALQLSGTAAPGSMVTLSSGGAIIGAVTTDETGNWTAAIDVPVSGDIQIESIDATGNAVTTTITPPVVEDTESEPTEGEIAESDGQESEAATGEAGATGDGTESPETSEADTGTAGTTPGPVYPPQSIAGLLSGNPAEFSTLISALEATGLAEAFGGTGTFTLFAPANDAFEKLPAEVTEGLMMNPEALSQVLQYHATRGRYLAADLKVVAPSTLNNRLLTIAPTGDTLRINDATVTLADNVADNGVIHVIDRVLVPPLATGVRPPVIDESGVPTFSGTRLTVVGTAQPGSTILLEMNDEPFGSRVIADASGFWQVQGDITPGQYAIVAYMLDAGGALQAISRAVNLTVR